MSTEASKQEIISQFREMQRQLQDLTSQLAKVENDLRESELVGETLLPLESTRKCYRMVGGVLMERTVAEVLPAIQEQSTLLRRALTNMEQEYKDKESHLIQFTRQHHIQIKP